METKSSLLLDRSDVRKLLGLTECIDAVEMVFRRQGEGKIPPSGILGVKTQGGGLHVKTAPDRCEKLYRRQTEHELSAELHAFWFADNPGRNRYCATPTMVEYSAVLDSMEITIKRTAAATAVAAKYLARKNSSVAAICGCGEQGHAHLRALSLMFPLRKVYAFDIDPNASQCLAVKLSRESRADIEPVRSLPGAIQRSDVVVTCTPAIEFYVHKEDVAPGTFIAAVGADDSQKNEIDPALLASAKVVADSLQQVCSIGDTHHAIAQCLMRKEDVYAELSEVVAGKKAGRSNETDIIVFDSTGVAIEDAAAATVVYEKALIAGIGDYFEFAA